MKPCSCSILIRPVCCIFFLVVPCFMILKSCLMVKYIEQNAALLSTQLQNISFTEIEDTAKLLIPLNTTGSNLARALSSSLDGAILSFSAIQSKVAPALFQALSTIPLVSQVTYIGLDGLMFSFYHDNDYANDNDGVQTFAVFSNSSSSKVWFTQPVNRDTGKLYGKAFSSQPFLLMNESWIQGAINGTNAITSLGIGWNKDQDLMVFNTLPMDGRGVISIAFPAQLIADHFSGLELYGGDFHLATKDGQVLVRNKLPNTQIYVNNDTVLLQLKNMDGDPYLGNYSCKLEDGSRGHVHLNVKDTKHIFFCSTLNIAGIESVYVLAFPTNGIYSKIYGHSKIVLLLLACAFAIVVISLCFFIVLILRAARREMFICAALVKQMESTQQAERKSMNKSLAFARSSHDVRASLAAITGLIELCRENTRLNSEVAANLMHMSTCANDLLGILNSVLDTSKIEAGKMQLEEEEFNLAQLLEDVVDRFYPLGMKKGVDVVLDPSDGSILKFYLVRGDQGKLKQILSNLLNNAIKFTSEGCVSVRAMARKPRKENAIIASNSSSIFSCISNLCDKHSGTLGSLDDLHTVQKGPNSMEFIFEVEDTGKGIPKDKWKSVFENFVQVKDTAVWQEGCGLGLGIVQSLVRLMGGEIKIVDKDQGGNGTCFRFNIFLAANENTSIDIGVHNSYTSNNGPHKDTHHQLVMLPMRSLSPRSERSYVIALLAGEQRGRVIKKAVESLGIRVSVVWKSEDLSHNLERIKLKLEPIQSSPDTCSIGHLKKSSSASSNSKSGAYGEGASRTPDVRDTAAQHGRNSSPRGPWTFVLIVIDAAAGPYLELRSVVANFMKDINNTYCKVVWLDNPISRDSKEPAEDCQPCDYIVSKPFHGSRLYQVLQLLPELNGTYYLGNNCPGPSGETAQECLHSTVEVREDDELCKDVSSTEQKHLLPQIVVHDNRDEQSNERLPLRGKRVLLVEDTEILRKLTLATLCKLGATVDVCVNGKEAFDMVWRILNDDERGCSEAFPYDYIFMDCQMPVMDGYEATRLIRKEEKIHGIHIPIIALTAHAMPEERRKSTAAGMDFHLSKPLRVEKLLDTVRSLSENNDFRR